MLQELAEELGSSVRFTASDRHPVEVATVASPLAHRRDLRINARPVERRWSISGDEALEGRPVINGTTGDLAAIVTVAQSWRDGAPLEEIRRAAPFVHLTGRFEVPDRDPARLAEAEWQYLRTLAAESEWPGPPQVALLDAAYAEPRFRALYPFTSHDVLRFSTATRQNLAPVGPSLAAHAADRFTVSSDFLVKDILAETTTAQEAVAAALEHLPTGLGPVTLT